MTRPDARSSDTEPSAPPARNRATPTGTIVAAPGRGAFMGNRGLLHDGTGTRDIVRNFQSKAWLTCALSYQGRTLPQWEPGRYTQLFFLDEAVALAAGHRPCALCRRGAFTAYREAWAAGQDGAPPAAPQMDAQLHRQRLPVGDERPSATMPWASLPDGTFVLTEAGPAVVVGDHLTLYDDATNTYTTRAPRPRTGDADVLTPPATVAVLAHGYSVQIDDAAR